MRSLDEPLRQPKPGAKRAFASRHLACVGFMVVSGEMKQPVQHEHLDLSGERMALFSSLSTSRWNTDGEIAGYFCRNRFGRGKGKHVSRLVLASETAIEPANLCVRSQQNSHLATQSSGGLSFPEEASQCASGRHTMAAGNRGPYGAARPFRRIRTRRGVRLQIWVEEDHLA